MPGKLRVTLRKSPISYTARAHGTLRAIGLRRIGQTVEVKDDAAMRGQVRDELVPACPRLEGPGHEEHEGERDA